MHHAISFRAASNDKLAPPSRGFSFSENETSEAHRVGRVWDLGLRHLVFEVEGLGSGMFFLGCRLWGLGCRVWDVGCRV